MGPGLRHLRARLSHSPGPLPPSPPLVIHMKLTLLLSAALLCLVSAPVSARPPTDEPILPAFDWAPMVSATDNYAVAMIDGCAHAMAIDGEGSITLRAPSTGSALAAPLLLSPQAKAMLQERQGMVCCACGPAICDQWWCYFYIDCMVWGDSPCCCEATISPNGRIECECHGGACW